MFIREVPIPVPVSLGKGYCNRTSGPRLVFRQLQTTSENYRKLQKNYRRFMKILVGLPFRGARRAPLVLLQMILVEGFNAVTCLWPHVT